MSTTTAAVVTANGSAGGSPYRNKTWHNPDKTGPVKSTGVRDVAKTSQRQLKIQQLQDQLQQLQRDQAAEENVRQVSLAAQWEPPQRLQPSAPPTITYAAMRDSSDDDAGDAAWSKSAVKKGRET